MNINYHYGKPNSLSYPDLLDISSTENLNSLKTSTLPMLQYWKNSTSKLRKYINEFKLTDSDFEFCLEYPTRSYKSNKSSMTDLMLISNDYKIAIEAKYTEVKHPYELISTWNKNTENRKSVLQHWKQIIENYSNGIDDELLNTIPYQFFHRVASSCFASPKQAITVYQIFYDNDTRDQSIEFCNLLKDSAKKINPKEELKIYLHLIETEMIKDENIKINNALQHLKDKEIFDFGSEKFERI
jgi:hypothetical protein